MVSLIRRIGGVRMLDYALWALVLLISISAWLDLRDRMQAMFKPETHHHLLVNRMTKPVYKVGEPLVTYIEVDRQMPPDCVLTIYRHLADADTGVLVFSQFAPGIAENGIHTYSRVIPAAPPPGRYVYFFDVVDRCSSIAQPLPVHSPRSAPFEIVP